MDLNSEQISAIKEALEVDLSTVESDRLVELCLMHRSVPDASIDFINRLITEFQRRYSTKTAVANEDITFAVILKFIYELDSPVPKAFIKFKELEAQINRQNWFSQNQLWLRNTLNNPKVAKWLVEENQQILEIILNDTEIGLHEIAKNDNLPLAIVSNPTAYSMLQTTNDLWTVWPLYQNSVEALCYSDDVLDWVTNDANIMNAIAASSVAMQTIANFPKALNRIGTNTTVMTAIANNQAGRDLILGNDDLFNTWFVNPNPNEEQLVKFVLQEADVEYQTGIDTWQKMVNSNASMELIASNTNCMRIIAENSNAIDAVVTRNDAMQFIGNSATALNEIAENDYSRSKIYSNNTFFNSVFKRNSPLESSLVKITLFECNTSDKNYTQWEQFNSDYNVMRDIMSNFNAGKGMLYHQSGLNAIDSDNVAATALTNSSSQLFKAMMDNSYSLFSLRNTEVIFDKIINTNDYWNYGLNGNIQDIIASNYMHGKIAGNAKFDAVIASATAMEKVAASATAMEKVAASATAMEKVAASETAMEKVIVSATAMEKVAASATAMEKVAASATAKDKLTLHNNILQDLRITIYNTLNNSDKWNIVENFRTAWLEGYSEKYDVPGRIIFFCGSKNNDNNSDTRIRMKHFNNRIASEIPSRGKRNIFVNNIDYNHGISFSGCRFEDISNGNSYIHVIIFEPK